MNWWNFKTKHDLTSFLKVTITSVVLCTFRIDPVESAKCEFKQKRGKTEKEHYSSQQNSRGKSGEKGTN